MEGATFEGKLEEIAARLCAIEQELIEQREMQALGHRIVYDPETGYSLNIGGDYCDPSKLDENGYQVRL